MKRWLLLGVAVAACGMFAWQSLSQQRAPASSSQQPPPETRATVSRQPMAVWSTCLGRLEPRTPITVTSRSRAAATVVELVAEGTVVSRGDVLARLNAAPAEREVLKSERDRALAELELSSFRSAKAPLEIQELTIKVLESRSSHSAENTYLQAMTGLARDGLISPQEMARQKDKVEELRIQLEKAELQLRLTREHLHPSEVKRGQVRLAAAEYELRFARQQVQDSAILAPASGVVIHTPLYQGPELRNLRIGDSLNPNQPFAMLYDMKDLVVQCEIPESELQKIQEKKEVAIQPLAYPELRIRGVVEKVSPVANNAPGRPIWQKTFSILMRLVDLDPRLKPGMSVTAHVLSYYNPTALSVPRSAVSWENEKPVVTVVSGSSFEARPVRVGWVNERSYEVVEGLSAGDVVLVQ